MKKYLKVVKIPNKRISRFINLTNKEFEYFKVLKCLGNNLYGCAIWLCLCKCGKEFCTTTNFIMKKYKKSCGCHNFLAKHANQKYTLEEASYRAKVSNFKAQAKQRKIEWDLSIEQTIKLMKENCYYCGSIPINYYDLARNKQNAYKILKIGQCVIYYNGIDRIDNTQGYFKDNCVSCCKICNCAKNILSTNAFKKWIKSVYTHLNLDRAL